MASGQVSPCKDGTRPDFGEAVVKPPRPSCIQHESRKVVTNIEPQHIVLAGLRSLGGSAGVLTRGLQISAVREG